MSVLNELPTIAYLVSFTSLGLISIVLSLLIIKTKTLVYNAFILAGIALSVSALIAMLGFQVIAAIQIIVYVGAAVLFFIISLSMIGESKAESVDPAIPAVIGVVSFVVFYLVIYTVSSSMPAQPSPTILNGSDLSSYLLNEFAFPLIIASCGIIIASAFSIYLSKSIKRGGRKQ